MCGVRSCWIQALRHSCAAGSLGVSLVAVTQQALTALYLLIDPDRLFCPTRYTAGAKLETGVPIVGLLAIEFWAMHVSSVYYPGSLLWSLCVTHTRPAQASLMNPCASIIQPWLVDAAVQTEPPQQPLHPSAYSACLSQMSSEEVHTFWVVLCATLPC